MATGMQVWSQTAATNASVDSNVNWAEGQAPSSVNDSARAGMASAAKWVSDNNGTVPTTGTGSAYTAASNQVSAANTDGYTISVLFHTANLAGATFALDGNTAAPLQINVGVNVGQGVYKPNTIHRFTYNAANTAWVENSGVGLNAVHYNNLQLSGDGTLLGNVQGSNWPAQELTIGAGLVISTTSTSTSQSAFNSTSTSTAIPFTISAPAFPPTAAFKNLSIKVTGTSSATAAADFATLATSGSSQFQTVALSGNINLGANGAVNALDTGSLASGTWYALYGIANAAGTLQGFLASTSFTTPLMPSGYSYKARLGALITSTSTASAQLMGTWQLGRNARYVVGLAATSHLPEPISGVSGNLSAPTWTAVSLTNLVAPTAASVNGFVINQNNSGGTAMLAPNNSYGAFNSGSNPPPVVTGVSSSGQFSTNAPFNLLLESGSLYYASNTSQVGAFVQGWQDNL